MLFPNPDMAVRIMEERVKDSLRNAERAQLLREVNGTHTAAPNVYAALLAKLRNLSHSLQSTPQNPKPVKKGTSLSSV